MEQISPWHAVDPLWSWEGQGSGFLLPPPPPPQRSSSVQCLRSCSSLGTSWQVSAPAVRTRGTLTVRAMKKKLPSSPERSDAPTRPGGGAGSRPGSAVRPQPPRFCPLLVVHSLTLPLTSPSPPSSAAPGQSQDPGSRTQLTPKTTNSKRHQSTLTRTPGQ